MRGACCWRCDGQLPQAGRKGSFRVRGNDPGGSLVLRYSGMPVSTEKTLCLSEISPGAIQSEIRAMTVECDRHGGVNLAQGVCDTPLPGPVEESAILSIRKGHNIYTRADGIASLRQAIAEKLERHNHIKADPESEIVVTSGATAAFYSACLALFNAGDEILLFEPFYGYHVNTLQSLRIKPVTIPLAEATWEIDFDALRASITPRTRAIVAQHAQQSLRQGLHARGVGDACRLRYRERSLCAHRRNLRVLPLRGSPPHQHCGTAWDGESEPSPSPDSRRPSA